MIGKKCKYIFYLIFLYYSSNNDYNNLNKQFIEFFREYFISVEFTPEKNIIIRFYISLFQTYIETLKKFDNILISAWDNEIKPFILQKFPITQEGLFSVNSDLKFVMDIIDSLKEKFAVKTSDLEIKNENNVLNNENDHFDEGKKENNKDLNKDIKKEEEIPQKPIKYKRRGTEKLLSELENLQNFSNNTNDKNIKDKYIYDKEKDIELLRKENISKINMFLLEFINNNNILEPKRTNSMINLRPHSQTIDSKTTCDTSIKEDNIILNINNLITNKNYENNNINNDPNRKEKLNNSNIENNNTEKKAKNPYGNIFMEEDSLDSEKKEKIKTHLRSKTINLIREMNPFYKEDIESEGYTIAYKNPEKILAYIYPDILLQKIIFEDFIKKNVLLIHHFCKQCFCFVNKEIFFRKIFHCYNYYKKNTSNNKLKNLIEFINVLVLEMLEYYSKINLKDIHIIHIKKFYSELITDLVINLENTEMENENDKKNNCDNAKNEDDKNRILNDNNNDNDNIINRKNLINKNLNIELKNIKIFIFKDKEIEKEKKEENNKKKKNCLSNSPLLINKSLTFRQSLPTYNSKSSFLLNNLENKDFKEEKEKSEQNKDNEKKDIKPVSRKEVNQVLSQIIEEEKEELKDDDLFLKVKENINEDKKEKEPKEENNLNEQNDLNENKEKKQKLFMISKTLRKSQVVSLKKTLKDSIIEEDEEQRDNSDKEQKNNSFYSEKSSNRSKSSSSSSQSNSSGNDSDKNEEKKIKKKNTKETKEKEEEENKQKLELINQLLKENNISTENLININEKILNEISYILILFESDNDGEPSYQDIKEAKDHINFYKTLQNIINKQKKIAILPRQRQKRLTKNYTSFFNLGTISNKAKMSRDYLKKGYFCIVDWKTEEIGDQLIKVSRGLLNKIYPRELYRAIFLKKDKEITSPNVIDCINKFNRLTSFIIEDILSYDFPRERARVYEKWVSIAEYCKMNKDYNDLVAIFSALNNYIITGLKLTLKEVKSKFNNMFRQINEFCSVEGNYRNIREDMNNCEKTGEIFVPYLGMLMRDINFFEESSKYINENGCINFEKIEKINELFDKYFKFKSVPEKKTKIKELMFFEDLEDITEEKLEELANNLEPQFKIREIQKPGKRPTNIDKKYFEEYKDKFASPFSGNIKDNYIRRTISVLK